MIFIYSLIYILFTNKFTIKDLYGKNINFVFLVFLMEKCFSFILPGMIIVFAMKKRGNTIDIH